MVPLPKWQNPQRQSLTVWLSKICRDYPAGAGVLRELLQNADDAGASTMKFVLDTRTHRQSPVLVDGLAEYQGPALLAYNDALFSDRDFQSLSSVGNSQKVEQKATTGKFGLGFNSVYNWTDCPSIISGSTLLLLDPNHFWSSDIHPPGGPAYDFPPDAQDEAMANHLSCFSLINTEWGRPFHGTIIRIPLRNESQAKKSEISNKASSTKDVRRSMDSFAHEMGTEGLLFLRSVQRILLSVGNERLSEVEIVDIDALTEPKNRLQNMLHGITELGDTSDGDVYYELRLRYWTKEHQVERTYGVLNLVKGAAADASLTKWAAGKKLFPWVAIAAPLTREGRKAGLGRLYSVLPLPIMTRLPAHVHGLFSISEDRSRLHGLDDSGVQDIQPESWNRFLFDQLIPAAWAKLLVNICQNRQHQNFFHLWPKSTSNYEWWCDICGGILEIVCRNNDPVWFTEYGYIGMNDGIIAPIKTQPRLKQALHEAGLRVICLPDHLLEGAQKLPVTRHLCPSTLFDHLVDSGSSDCLSKPSKLEILKYFGRIIPLKDLAVLEIFPFDDGTLRSLRPPPVFLHRDVQEEELFSRHPESNLDTNELPGSTSTWFHEQANDGSSLVSYRTPADLRDYFLSHIANGSSDTLIIGEEDKHVLTMVWEWLMRKYPGRLPLQDIGSLWLVPLRNSIYRKLIPYNGSSCATWFSPGKVEDLAIEIITVDTENGPKLVENDAMDDMTVECLLSHAKTERALKLRNGTDLAGFLKFLKDGRILLQNAAEYTKASVFRTVRKMYLKEQNQLSDDDKDALRALHIFQKVSWQTSATSSSPMTRCWTDLSKNIEFIGVRRLVPLPSLKKRVFIDATDESVYALLKDLDFMQCLDELQILEQLVIPALQRNKYRWVRSDIRLEAMQLLFRNYLRLSPSAQGRIASVPAVPLERRGSDSITSFGCVVDLVDSQESALTSLFFDDEQNWVEADFYKEFSGILAICGMIKELNESLALDRIKAYEKKLLSHDVVASRATMLLQTPFRLSDFSSEEFVHAVRNCLWLPARSPAGNSSLVSSGECRDIHDLPLVGCVWHILPFRVEKNWRSLLGWQHRIPCEVLMSQLSRIFQLFESTGEPDFVSTGQTLSYLTRHYDVEAYLDRLLLMRFVQTSEQSFISPAQACRRGADQLKPYLSNVASGFWGKHDRLLTLANVPELPVLPQLRYVQEALELENELNEADLDVAMEVVRIWASRFSSSFEGLKVPDETGRLVDVGSLVFNDASWISDVDCALAHPKLSRAVADQLGMQPVSDLLRNGELGITDFDDDEFNQREEVSDGIRDTLDRYTRESTFHEYLANADDSGSAFAVNFLVDETSYNTDHLLTPDLSILQGPSLLIHNDGVFQEKDWEGLKLVGRGSKRDDPATIGKFGRGSQTMYHWTDVPMILSGHFLLILDPQRKYLPFNYRSRQRKPGIKIAYTKLKAKCPDQLAPFEGMWGFNRDQDYYNGTIFRFPLRYEGVKSDLMESLRCPNAGMAAQMFQSCLDEARSTLLFLRNINSIDFCIGKTANLDWRVSRGKWPESGTFSDWAVVVVERCKSQNTLPVSQRWWRAIADVSDSPDSLQYRHKRRMKYVECGIAGHVPTDEETRTTSLNPLKFRFFNCVPLKFESTLPVQVHATFLLSGDRQNIAIEETSHDAGSDWNKWLLSEKIPEVYLQFLEDVARKIGSDVYRYFPVEQDHGHQRLSDLVREAFWGKITSSRHRLFPVVESNRDEAMQQRRALNPERRRVPQLTEAAHASFDLLHKRQSRAFRPLLSDCVESLVCPPMKVKQYIKTNAQLTFVTPSLVRQILKSDEAAQHVGEMMRVGGESFSLLLSFICPEADNDLVELDDCNILPLMDGGLGKMSLIANDKDSADHQTFFLANSHCQSLFSDASPYLVKEKGNKEFISRILETGKFNVQRFDKKHAAFMLRCKKSWTIDSTLRGWLFDFWAFINSTFRAKGFQEGQDLSPLDHFPLLLCRQGGSDTLKSLSSFHNSTAVVEASTTAVKDIYADFSDLDIVDPKTLPKSWYDDYGTTLSDVKPMSRFLKSLEILATNDAENVIDYVRSRLRKKNAATLRTILIGYSAKTFASLPDTAKELPVWPRISSPEGHLAIKEALVTHNSAFVVPWMKDHERFIHNRECFGIKAIESIQILQDYVLQHLPAAIDESNKSSYLGFVSSLAQDKKLKEKKLNSVLRLNDYRLAARQDGRLCNANELYHHEDRVFAAAFRSEASVKFLMREVRVHLSLWERLGLRRAQNGRYADSDYLACVRALQPRLVGSADPQLSTDTQIVLSPLHVDNSTVLALNQDTWQATRQIAVFPVATAADGDVAFRSNRVAHLASRGRVLSMEQIVRHEHAAVCWSQTPFVLHEPSSTVLGRAGLSNQPDCAMVWDHLIFLTQCSQSLDEAEVESFMSDLEKTYEYLHLNQQQSEAKFTCHDAAIWLNPDATKSTPITLDVLQSSWTSLDNLLLDSPCDAPPLMMVHPFLGRFSSLLKLIGCKSVHYPSIALHSGERPTAALAVIRQLREKNILNDVRFQAEGSEISAHRVILASRSQYCERQFHGPWASAYESNMTNRIVELEDMTYATLKIMIDYCYDEHLEWAADFRVQDGEDMSLTAEKLDALLDVLVAADRWLMPDLHSDAERQVISGIRFFVRPDNVKSVEKVAGEANAEELKKYCQEFIVENPEAIMLASADY